MCIAYLAIPTDVLQEEETSNRRTVNPMMPMPHDINAIRQLMVISSPIIALVLIKFAYLGTFKATILANFIGALIFFWIDKWIFNRNIYFKR
jgi:hypothetical protein